MIKPDTAAWDAVNRLEAAFFQTLRRTGSAEAAEQGVAAQLATLPEAERNAIAERLRRRAPKPKTLAPLKLASAPSGDAAPSPGQRPAWLDTKAELENSVKHLRMQLDASHQQHTAETRRADELELELSEKAGSARQLQQRLKEVEQRLQQADQQRQQVVEERRALEAQLSAAQKDAEDRRAQSLKLHTQLVECQEQLREGKAAAQGHAAEEEAAQEAAASAEGAAAGDRQGSSPSAHAVYEAFCERIVNSGAAQADELPEPSDEMDRRLGVVAADLARFCQEVDATVSGQIESLAPRHNSLQQMRRILAFSHPEGEVRAWLWVLRAPAAAGASPERRFEPMIQPIRRLNACLLTASFQLVVTQLEKIARKLISPVEIRTAVGSSNPSSLWNHFESVTANRLPAALVDTCEAEFVDSLLQLYRFQGNR